jgi:uncharacterized coiled-coil protein SlyX
MPGDYTDVGTARPDEEHELDSRLRDRDRTIEELNLRLRELTGLLHKEQATRESLTRRLTTRAPQVLARRQPQTRGAKARTPPKKKRKRTARRPFPKIQYPRYAQASLAKEVRVAQAQMRRRAKRTSIKRGTTTDEQPVQN